MASRQSKEMQSSERCNNIDNGSLTGFIFGHDYLCDADFRISCGLDPSSKTHCRGPGRGIWWKRPSRRWSPESGREAMASGRSNEGERGWLWGRPHMLLLRASR